MKTAAVGIAENDTSAGAVGQELPAGRHTDAEPALLFAQGQLCCRTNGRLGASRGQHQRYMGHGVRCGRTLFVCGGLGECRGSSRKRKSDEQGPQLRMVHGVPPPVRLDVC